MTGPLDFQVLRPHPGVLAFYDGRVPGRRFIEADNWVDDGALSLGIASYAIVSGTSALVYDTHCSVPHAERVRQALWAEGVRDFTVVLSHWHLDHVAGTAAFPGAPVIANKRTTAHLTAGRAEIERGDRPPPIRPLILPTQTFTGQMTLTIGAVTVELIEANIHSDDATVIWWPDAGLLFAGDTVEDTVTYVGESGAFATHLADLDRLASLKPRRILPNHGAPGVIAAGGYSPALIPATQSYIRWLMGLHDDPARAAVPLQEVLADPLAAGTLTWFEPYAAIHAQNIRRTLAR
jgi:cyclase